jgi:hypothetical protein
MFASRPRRSARVARGPVRPTALIEKQRSGAGRLLPVPCECLGYGDALARFGGQEQQRLRVGDAGQRTAVTGQVAGVSPRCQAAECSTAAVREGRHGLQRRLSLGDRACASHRRVLVAAAAFESGSVRARGAGLQLGGEPEPRWAPSVALGYRRGPRPPLSHLARSATALGEKIRKRRALPLGTVAAAPSRGSSTCTVLACAAFRPASRPHGRPPA